MSSGAGATRLARGWSGGPAALTLGVVALLVWTLFGIGDVGRVIGTVGAIWSRPDLLAAFVVSYSAAFGLRAVAWRLLIQGGSPAVLRLFGFLQVALLANHLFPTKVGEVVRVALLARAGTPVAAAAGSTLLARLLDLASLCLLALVWAPLAGERSASLLTALALPLGLLLLAGAGLHAGATGHLAWLTARLPRRLAALSPSLQAAIRAVPPRRIGLALAAALPAWVLEGVALWAVAQAAGLEVSFALAVTATAFTIAFQGFQFTPGGIGLYEASLTGVLVLYGVEPGAALGLALATHALKFAYSYGAGLIALGAEAARDIQVADAGRARRQLARAWAWADPAFNLALLGVGMSAVLLPDLLPSPGGLGLAAAVALPLVILGRSHHLPRRLRWLLLVPPAVFGGLFGIPSPAAALAVLLLGGGALALGLSRVGAVIWATFLGQVVVAGATDAGGLAAFGMAALAIALLARQWWTTHHPLPRPEPVPPGATLAVVIPVHDEAASIGDVVARVPRAALAQRGLTTLVLVVDDGSRDASAANARLAGADLVLTHPERRGLGAALRTGLDAAREVGAAAAVYLDGDGEYDPRDIVRVAEPVLSGQADYVLGSRFPGAGRLMCRARRCGNLGFTLLLSLLTGRRLADGQTGFRAFGQRSLAVAEIIHDYNYAQVLTLNLLRKGMRLAEVPISYRPRPAGTSFIRYGEYARRVLPAMGRELLSP